MRTPDARDNRLRTFARGHAGALTGLVVAMLVLAPAALRPGYLLWYDMVFVPHLPLSAGTLGLDGGVPRAVPNDLVVALLNLALPGWIVQRIVLLGAFIAVGVGVDRWRRGPIVAVVATVAATWNPWFAERLSIGHWGYLWGYAALVWAVVGGLDLRSATGRTAPDDNRCARATTTIGVALIMSALSGSTGAVLVAIALLILLASPGPGRPNWRVLMGGAAAWVLLNAPWWFAFLTGSSANAADARGVSAFASRADTPLGVLGSLLSGGGIWHTPSWFAERNSPLIATLAALVVVVGLVGLVRSARDLRLGLVVLAAAGLVLASLGSWSFTASALTHLVQTVPGAGLLRDGQKFMALGVVPAALGWGVVASSLRGRMRGTLAAPVAVVGAVVLPVILLPGLAFARGGAWSAHSYPQEYERVAARISSSDQATLVLPWQLYRRYTWNDDRVVLDPWPRLSASSVIVNDDLPLRDGVVRGENPTSARLGRALASGDATSFRDALRAASVRYVVLERTQPGADQDARMLASVGHLTSTGRYLAVYEVDGASAAPQPGAWRAAGLASGAAGIALCCALILHRRRHDGGTAR